MLRTFAEISGLNIVIDPTVQGTVDVALRDVPWDQALDIILRANKLGYLVDGTIVRIAPLDRARRRGERSAASSREEQALAGRARSADQDAQLREGRGARPLLTQERAVAARHGAGRSADQHADHHRPAGPARRRATDLIATLDTPQPQVEIEARIVQTNKNYARALGVQWGFNGTWIPALGNTTNLAFPNNGSARRRASARTQGPAPAATADRRQPRRAPARRAPSAWRSARSTARSTSTSRCRALESSGNGRLLSTPRVTTQNNVAAEMTQGVQIPIQTVANNTVTVQFKDAALTLKVTPQITAADTVIMQISVENATPDFSRSGQRHSADQHAARQHARCS